jgi:uncharacterized delta-60 repeat protein
MRLYVGISALACFALLAGVARPALAAAGDLDTSFGTNGLVRTDFTPKADRGIGMALQSDGKIIVVGSAGGPNSKFAVARYNTLDGTLDTSFGAAHTGKVMTDMSTGADFAIPVAIDSVSGDIVVAGVVAENTANAKWGIVRYTPAGLLDTTFGAAGTGKIVKDLTPKWDEVLGVGIQSDHSIVVSGGVGAGGSNPNFAVLKLDTTGHLVSGFGTGGIVRTDFNSGSIDFGEGGLVVQSDDKIVVGGFSASPSRPNNARFAVARYDGATGALDNTFSGDGKVTLDFTTGFDDIYGMAIEPSDAIVAAGEAGAGSADSKAALARFTAAGVPDTTFSGDGKQPTNYGSHQDFADWVAIDSGDNLVTAGGVGLGGSNPRFAIARYDASGTLDATFGIGGTVFTDFGPNSDYALSAAIQPSDGKILAAGVAGVGSGNSKFAVARYLAS